MVGCPVSGSSKAISLMNERGVKTWAAFVRSLDFEDSGFVFVSISVFLSVILRFVIEVSNGILVSGGALVQ